MKKFGIIIFCMAIGFLYSNTGWAGKKGAKQGTETADCYLQEPFAYEGQINDANPTDQKCNSEIPACKGECTAQSITNKTLKNKSAKEKANFNKKNNKYFKYSLYYFQKLRK